MARAARTNSPQRRGHSFSVALQRQGPRQRKTEDKELETRDRAAYDETNLPIIGHIIMITITILEGITGNIIGDGARLIGINHDAVEGRNTTMMKTNETAIGKSIIEDTPTKNMVRNAFGHYALRGRKKEVGPKGDSGSMNILTDHRSHRRDALLPRLRRARRQDQRHHQHHRHFYLLLQRPQRRPRHPERS